MGWKLRRLVQSALGIMMLVACSTESEQTFIAAGRLALEKGDLKTASVQLKSALEKNPESAQARFLFARLLLESGNFRAAEIELRKAQERAHPVDEVAPLLARSLLARQEYQKIINDFAKVELSRPDSQADLSTSVATAFALSGQVDQAAALADSVIAKAPEHVPIRLLKARLTAGRGDVDGALKVLDQIIVRSASNADVWRLQGDLLMYGKQDRSKAQAAYRKVLEIRPGDIVAHSQLIVGHLMEKNLDAAQKQYEALVKVQPTNTQTALIGAYFALQSGKPGRARELTTQLLRLAKDDPKVLLLAAVAEAQLNSLVQAESHLNKVLSIDPNDSAARRLLASIHLRTGQTPKALEVLRPLLDGATADAEALSLAAEAHLQSGDAKRAEAFFVRVTQVKPDDVKAGTALALSQLARGDVAPAFEKLRALAQGDKGTLADMVLINARLRQRDLDGALKAIDALDLKLTGKALPADLRGRVSLLKRDSAGARANFEQALLRDPVYLPSATALAHLDLLDNKSAAAQTRFESILKIDANNVRALVALAALREKLGASEDEVAQLLVRAVDADPGEPATRVLLVNHWLKHGNAKQALSVAQTALAANQDDPSLLDALGRAQLANDEVAQSLSTFGKLASRLPNSAFAQLRVADAQLRAKNPAAAEQALRRALEISPDLLAAQRGLIMLAFQAKQPEKALTIARTIQKQRPNEAVGHVLEGNAHFQFQEWDKASKAFRAGLQKKGAGAAAIRLYAVLGTANRKTEADQFAAEWIRQHPRDFAFRTYLGAEAMAAGNLALAEQRYGEIVALDPRNAAATNDLAWVMAKNKKPGAVAMAERALALAPDDPNVLDTLAFALGEENQLVRAIETAKKAVGLSAQSPVFRLNLAKLHLKAGDKKGAKSELDELAKLGAKFDAHQEVTELRSRL